MPGFVAARGVLPGHSKGHVAIGRLPTPKQLSIPSGVFYTFSTARHRGVASG